MHIYLSIYLMIYLSNHLYPASARERQRLGAGERRHRESPGKSRNRGALGTLFCSMFLAIRPKVSPMGPTIPMSPGPPLISSATPAGGTSAPRAGRPGAPGRCCCFIDLYIDCDVICIS